MDSIEKGNLGEEFVNAIAYRSFLKYWCYPGPLDIAKDNKEICDLLIVFKHICIIISVKNYSFKGNYDQYFRKTADKAIRQIKGAERTLFREDTPVLLKHPDREVELFSKSNVTATYRIIINLNTDVKYYQTSFFLEERSYMVMDALAWYSAVQELDSIIDFTNYVSARSKLFDKYPAFIMPREESDISAMDQESAWNTMVASAQASKGLSLVSGSELDLIAVYFSHAFEFPKEYHCNDEDKSRVLKLDGWWETFQNSKVSQLKSDEEKESEFIDRLVREFLISSKDGNHLAAMFFQLDKWDRAAFARAFLEYHSGIPNDAMINRTHVAFSFMNMVFIYFDDSCPIEQLESFLSASLQHHLYLFNYTCKEVGGLGMSKSGNKFLFGYVKQQEPYTANEIEEIRQSFIELGWKTDQTNLFDIDFG